MLSTKEMLAAKFGSIFAHLDEQRRLMTMGVEAQALGHDGIRVVAQAAGVCDIRQLLDQAGHTIQPGPHHLTSLDDLYRLAAQMASAAHRG